MKFPSICNFVLRLYPGDQKSAKPAKSKKPASWWPPTRGLTGRSKVSKRRVSLTTIQSWERPTSKERFLVGLKRGFVASGVATGAMLIAFAGYGIKVAAPHIAAGVHSALGCHVLIPILIAVGATLAAIAIATAIGFGIYKLYRYVQQKNAAKAAMNGKAENRVPPCADLVDATVLSDNSSVLPLSAMTLSQLNDEKSICEKKCEDCTNMIENDKAWSSYYLKKNDLKGLSAAQTSCSNHRKELATNEAYLKEVNEQIKTQQIEAQ